MVSCKGKISSASMLYLRNTFSRVYRLGKIRKFDRQLVQRSLSSFNTKVRQRYALPQAVGCGVALSLAITATFGSQVFEAETEESQEQRNLQMQYAKKKNNASLKLFCGNANIPLAKEIAKVKIRIIILL